MSGVGYQGLKARYVFPATAPPLTDAVVTVADGRIVAVGPPPADAPIEDLGNVAILPGLVNAHVHLEFSDLKRPLGATDGTFVGWLSVLVDRFRRGAEPADRAVARGWAESARCGTTALGEIAQPDWPVETFTGAGPQATVFLELIGSKPEAVAPRLEMARQHLAAASDAIDWHPGLSPHAPYSVQPGLLAEAIALSARHGVPLAMHLAESREEIELLRTGRGPLRDWLARWGRWDEGLVQPGSRPLDYLQRLAGAARAMVIHGNYLKAEEIALLAAHRERMSVVYCPRTHAYFGHAPYPLEEMFAAGVRVALGTDSRAAAPDLSLLGEMRFVAASYPLIARDRVLRMGTIDGAEALGRAAEIGSLEPGKSADLAVVALPDANAPDPHDLLFNSNTPVVATWCRGQRLP